MPVKYIIKAAGVTIICYDAESVKKWVAFIIERGDVPTVTEERETNEDNPYGNKDT